MIITEREKQLARLTLNNELARHPELKGSCCSICGTAMSIIGHHPNYRLPLYVIWICRSDHKHLHNEEDRKAALLLNGKDIFVWE